MQTTSVRIHKSEYHNTIKPPTDTSRKDIQTLCSFFCNSFSLLPFFSSFEFRNQNYCNEKDTYFNIYNTNFYRSQRTKQRHFAKSDCRNEHKTALRKSHSIQKKQSQKVSSFGIPRNFRRKKSGIPLSREIPFFSVLPFGCFQDLIISPEFFPLFLSEFLQ